MSQKEQKQQSRSMFLEFAALLTASELLGKWADRVRLARCPYEDYEVCMYNDNEETIAKALMTATIAFSLFMNMQSISALDLQVEHDIGTLPCRQFTHSRINLIQYAEPQDSRPDFQAMNIWWLQDCIEKVTW